MDIFSIVELLDLTYAYLFFVEMVVMYTFGKTFFDGKILFSRISNFATELFEVRTDHSSSFAKFLNFVEKLWLFKNTSSKKNVYTFGWLS